MKTKLYIILSYILFIVSGSCKKIDQLPSTSVTDATFWQSPNDLALACNALYPYLIGLSDADYKMGPYQEKYGTDAYGTAANQVSDGSRLAIASSTEWPSYYNLIRIANNIIEKGAKVDGEIVLIQQYLGEAHWFRAFAYFELVKRFGDVPLILKTLTTADAELNTPRTNREIIIDSVYADLDYAATYCPKIKSQQPTDYGRITRSAALALKSRIALFEGTRSKYFGYGTPSIHLQIAVDASSTVMSENEHSLYIYNAIKDSSYYYLFQYAADGSLGYSNNKESILSKLYYGASQSSYITANQISGVIGNRFFTATKALMNQYLYKDGLPRGKSAFYKAKEDSSLTEFMDRDPRIGMTIFNKKTRSSAYSLQVPNVVYIPRKWYVRTDHMGTGFGFLDFIVIRYAEVLLNYAEATYELNGSISDDDLNKTINLLRNRASNNTPAKLALLSNAFVSANGLDMLEEIRRERNVELALEGFNYWDLIRWKKAETELPKEMKGPRYFPNEMVGLAKPNIDADSIIIYQSGANRRFDAGKDYLWPIPTLQIALTNGAYTQNPGWE